MRHAQPQPSHPDGDKFRELDESGWAEARQLGEALQSEGIDYAIVSGATRARQTFEALGLDVPAEFQDALYTADTDQMMQRIGEMFEDMTQTLLVIGHAPTVPQLASILTSVSASREADALLCTFAPGSYQSFSFEGTWAAFAEDPASAKVVPDLGTAPGASCAF